MVFAPSILSVSSTLYERLLSLTSALSLAASAYSMKQFPLLRPSAKGKRRVLQAELASAEKTVLPVNSGICVLLGLVYALTSPAESPVTIRPALYLIPGGGLSPFFFHLISALRRSGGLYIVQQCSWLHWLHGK